MITNVSIQQRNTILEKHRALILNIRGLEAQIKKDKARAVELERERSTLLKKIEPLILEYWEWIPAVYVSRCPICHEKLYRRFDPVDLNGFWWMDRTQRPVKEPPCCPHFCLLLGAVDRHGIAFKGTLFECHPGPEQPFVVPRILEMPQMMAVVTFIPMTCGFTAYPVAYFSEQPPQGRNLSQSWARKEYHFTLEDGRKGWDIIEDEYDFDLDPWIEQGKVIKITQTIDS